MELLTSAGTLAELGCPSQDVGFNGPCICQNTLEQGTWRRMNLHEVMNEVVLQKYCHDLRAFSYAEYLKTFVRPDAGGRMVQTFVSHWWGEDCKNVVYESSCGIGW